MEGKLIISMMIALILVALLIPVSMNAYSQSRDMAANESEQLDYYNSLSDADKANYTSIYAEDGEPPTPWSYSSRALFGIVGIISIIAAMLATRD